MGLSLGDVGGWPGVLGRLIGGGDLSADEAELVLGEVLAGEASPAQLAAFVTALRVKGETVEEMTGLVRSMLAFAEALPLPGDLAARVVDTCGTGGDRRRTINVSTLAAFVVAGAGVPVCKHGGRAASSRAGSADLLEALGVVIDLGPAGVARCIEDAGIGFCFAPRFHPAMRFAAPVRRELGVATVFNFLGPLANPARARRQVVGVADADMAPKMLGVLRANGATHAIVCFGDDGLDELSTTGPSTMLELVDEGGASRAVRVDAGELGLARATLADLEGGGPEENAAIARAVLGGASGPARDIVVLNAAAGLVVGGAVEDLVSGVGMAARVLDEGRAAAALDALISTSRAAGEEAARGG